MASILGLKALHMSLTKSSLMDAHSCSTEAFREATFG